MASQKTYQIIFHRETHCSSLGMHDQKLNPNFMMTPEKLSDCMEQLCANLVINLWQLATKICRKIKEAKRKHCRNYVNKLISFSKSKKFEI